MVADFGRAGRPTGPARRERGCRPRPPVQAVDTTAAGDAFCGALAAALASGENLYDGVRLRLRGRRTGHHGDGGAPQPAEGGSGGTVVVRDLKPSALERQFRSHARGTLGGRGFAGAREPSLLLRAEYHRQQRGGVRVLVKRAWVCSACGQVAAGGQLGAGAQVAAGGQFGAGDQFGAGERFPVAADPPAGSVSPLGGPHCRNLWCAAPDRALEAVFAVGNYEGAFGRRSWPTSTGGTCAGPYLRRDSVPVPGPPGDVVRGVRRYLPGATVHGPGRTTALGPRGPHVRRGKPSGRRRLAGRAPVTKVFETDVMSSKGGLARRDLAKRSLRRAFAVTDPGAVEGRRILLVDDVCASGYTLLTVARALRRSGADEVAAVVLARARWRPH